MAKDDGGRLLSKVAKFVRNPLKDWSDLESQDSQLPEDAYSREMLKEMIERRQRNDFVRRREFDALRKLRQREAAGGRDAAAQMSSFHLSSSTGRTDGRALTLKKIDEIEEQMSQQWWRGRAPQPGEADSELPAPASAARPQHAAVVPDTAPGGLHPSRLQGDTSIEEAAIRFAHGDEGGAEAILLQAVAPDSPQADHADTWRALLDLYRALGDIDKFTAANTRFAQRFKRPGPEWVSLRMLAHEAQAARPPHGAAAPAAGAAAWASPARLTRESLTELTRALAAAGPVWSIDWRGLRVIDVGAAGPLRALFAHWGDAAAQLRFAGAEQLLAVLAAATPTGERQVDVVWWQLRMAVLRAMNAVDAFELAALNYCITYEVSPPAWQDPQGGYAALDAPASRPVALGEEPGAAAPPAQLVGELSGECVELLRRLDAELAGDDNATVSCAALVRLDFTAAGTLLNWVADRDARGARVKLVELHRLLASLFEVIGVDHHADIAVRLH